MGRGEKRKKIVQQPVEEQEYPSAFIIEMDGALFDSIPVLYRVYEEFLRSHGLEGTREDFRKIVGLSNPEYVLALADQYGLKKSLPLLLKQYEQLLNAHYNENLSLFPNAAQFLEFCFQQGISLALIANSGLALSRKILRSKNLLEKFDEIVSVEELYSDPLLYRNNYEYALSVLGHPREEVIAITNTNIATQQALEANIQTRMSFTQWIHD